MSAPTNARPSPDRPPHVVFIVSDDHGYADRGATGLHADVRTPALDRLAAEGVTCTNAYVTAPICSPSRAGMISGRYQQRWGALWFDTSEFPPDEQPTIAEALAAHGYRTGYFGKVHYGTEDVGDRACPPHHGFETTLYGLAGQSTGRLNYLRHSAEASSEYGPEATRWMAVQPLLSGDEPVEHEGFLTHLLGEQARAFVAEPDERPFFCMIAFNAVHNFCWQLPADELAKRGLPAHDDWRPGDVPYGEWYDDAISPNLEHGRAYYLAQLELMDAEIGRLLDLLEATGQADNTIVVYLTDNGGSTCNYGDNAPLRGTKYTLWEGGIRVPMIVRWPGRIDPGTSTDALLSSMDVYPTVVAAAGGDPGEWDHCDGADQLAALRGDSPGHDALHWEAGFAWAVRDGEWKLGFTDGDDAQVQHLASYEHAPMGSGLRLTRLVDDPGESRDLRHDHPDQVARLTALHAQWRAEVGLPAR